MGNLSRRRRGGILDTPAKPVSEPIFTPEGMRLLEGGSPAPLMPGHLYAFTADEIMELRRLLLPNRMARHDTPAETRLRHHANSIREAQGKKVMD